MDENLPESIGQHVFGLGSGPIANIGHQVLALEPPAHPVVNTFGLPPVGLCGMEIRLEDGMEEVKEEEEDEDRSKKRRKKMRRIRGKTKLGKRKRRVRQGERGRGSRR